MLAETDLSSIGERRLGETSSTAGIQQKDYQKRPEELPTRRVAATGASQKQP